MFPENLNLPAGFLWNVKKFSTFSDDIKDYNLYSVCEIQNFQETSNFCPLSPHLEISHSPLTSQKTNFL